MKIQIHLMLKDKCADVTTETITFAIMKKLWNVYIFNISLLAFLHADVYFLELYSPILSCVIHMQP